MLHPLITKRGLGCFWRGFSLGLTQVDQFMLWTRGGGGWCWVLLLLFWSGFFFIFYFWRQYCQGWKLFRWSAISSSRFLFLNKNLKAWPFHSRFFKERRKLFHLEDVFAGGVGEKPVLWEECSLHQKAAKSITSLSAQFRLFCRLR